MLEVHFLSEAGDELLVAAERYEEDVERLGSRFLAEVSRALEQIAHFPGIGNLHLAGTRRFLLTSFPYEIIYLVEHNSLLVVAIAHQHRSPGYWTGRV